MSRLNAIYTEKAQCQDCYKCLRHCPVKAIRVENGSALVETELCILCGNCVSICPVGAKRIRDDLSRAKQLMKERETVIVSLAPSWVTEWPDLQAEQLIHALRKLGFHMVSETALGAQIVSKACAGLLGKGEKIMISTACPVVVDFIGKYHPELKTFLPDIRSPLQAHAQYLHELNGESVGIVFAGPCIAKKKEVEDFPELIDVALTFEDLRQWFRSAEIDPYYLVSNESDCFMPSRSHDGALYPVDGGMVQGIKAYGDFPDVHFMSISGGTHIQHALEGLTEYQSERAIFIEILACDGGCVNGPRAHDPSRTAMKRLSIHDYAIPPENQEDIVASPALGAIPVGEVQPKKRYTLAEIDQALRKIGKIAATDELNCGGCGYNSCREFAVALLNGKAETAMCVSYMRNLALNKANALIKAMPSGIVIVDENLQVIECNKLFAEIVGGDALTVYDVNPGLSGAYLNRLIPFSKIFQQFISSNTDSTSRELRYNEKILRLSIFTIEPGHIIGGVIQDITQPSVQREAIITKAEQLIKQNLTTVQKIAFLLGENAAESEILLNSIIDSFGMKA